MSDSSTIRINFKGGIVSPGELKSILVAIKSLYVSDVSFGLRQQLIFQVERSNLKSLDERLRAINCEYQVDQNIYANTISSYVSEEVFQRSKWLTEGIYKDVLEQINSKARLKINISDADQSFCPFFTGHLNFISSSQPHFWYLYIRKPQSNELKLYSKLVYSNDIAVISAILDDWDYEDLGSATALEKLSENVDFISQEINEPLSLPSFSLPYYEGFNWYGEKTWLGIYQRHESFGLDFLIQICNLTQETKVGEICITPWKSIVIKNIKKENRALWSSLLAEYNINVRHAANELNWQIEDNSPVAKNLKRRLVDYFNKNDLRTFGLCLGIKTVPRTEVFASIMVRQKALMLLPFLKLYDITYTLDYDPNGREVAVFDKNLFSWNLPSRLISAVLKFNKENNASLLPQQQFVSQPERKTEQVITSQYQCTSCFTIYDEKYGDVLNQVSPLVPFSHLPASYLCSVCEGPKSSFVKLEHAVAN